MITPTRAVSNAERAVAQGGGSTDLRVTGHTFATELRQVYTVLRIERIP